MSNTTIEKQLTKTSTALHNTVTTTVEKFLDECGQPPTNLYDLVLEQLEEPLFKLLMAKTGGNQCEITRITGLARGTVRKKLKKYGFIQSQLKATSRKKGE